MMDTHAERVIALASEYAKAYTKECELLREHEFRVKQMSEVAERLRKAQEARRQSEALLKEELG